ncbi:ASCH domain-containing protein [Sphingobacterium corticibacterium]|uniref:ASCH domain-containing protein n=1 Tax=Sphingobacterium corticibacterium TaxID=2484746 RepID=A0A4Q6XP92_9SPHI|nr:ASCH domain-containing protein [Sphingobacterium corticibacterium]RZF61751.1 ASCH domain-containing protein [Sphingobacterium corticibacterium]
MIDTFWKEFQNEIREYSGVETPPAYYFCDNEKDADECAELVRKGIKQATTHSLTGLQINEEKLPVIGDLAIVTDWHGIPKAITKTVKVQLVKFKNITAEYAFIEGEGDRSLSYWQKVHWDYYTRELSDRGLQPSENMELVCEYFETI